MTTKKLPKAQVYKERTIHTYSELWHGSGVLLQRAKGEPKGSYWLWMGSLILTAFAFEAYLNHIGPKLFSYWDALETLSPENKLNVICEKLKIDLPKNNRPRQTVHGLFRFRNNLAHGKTITIKERFEIDVNQCTDKFLANQKATWETYCTKRNSDRVREDIEKVMRLIHEKANLENDPLYGFGMYSASAKLQQDF
ncbi:MAG: hypothetical protein QME75_08800 [Deltaproteobacteria bacterium]|nr:hypothetical protein [Deltaproteobacteria bacterium]